MALHPLELLLQVCLFHLCRTELPLHVAQFLLQGLHIAFELPHRVLGEVFGPGDHARVEVWER